jgi:hypothetical protein
MITHLTNTTKRKRNLSAAGRAAIVAAPEKRWDAVRAAKPQQEKAAAKKTATKKTKALPTGVARIGYSRKAMVPSD